MSDAFPILGRQNLIGAAIVAASLALMALMAVGYAIGKVPAWVAIPAIAFATSVLHEIEHDLIHNLYFKGSRGIQNLLFAAIWVAKIGANPWWRRSIHLRHHAMSGQVEDWEERLLGLGQPISLKRIANLVLPFFRTAWLKDVASTDPEFDPKHTLRANGIASLVYFGLSGLWVYAAWAGRDWRWVTVLAVVWLLPNVLRLACLSISTTMCHYYGDIPRNDVFYENQILDHWSLLPVHLFCFNFGSTHIIHHYLPPQPFYLRQLIARPVHQRMIQLGVRRNDLSALRRRSRWSL